MALVQWWSGFLVLFLKHHAIQLYAYFCALSKSVKIASFLDDRKRSSDESCHRDG